MPRSLLMVAVVSRCLLGGSIVDAQELTEREMLERFEPSLAAEALRRRVEEVRAEVRLRTLPPNPSIAFTREAVAGLADDFLVFRQDLPVTGQRRFLREAGAARVDVAAQTVDGLRRRLRADARQIFARALVAQEREAVALAAIGDLEGLVRVLRAREREGESSSFDRGRAEREQADVRSELARARIDLVRARGALQAFLTMPGTTVLRGSLDLVPVPALAEVAPRAASARSDYLAAEAAVQALRFEQRAAERLRLPQPAIAVGMKRTAVGGPTHTGYTAGIELRVPLFDRGLAARTLAQSALRRTEAERDALRARIDAEVETALAVAAASRALAEQYAADVAAGGLELARIARVAYEEGEQGILELLDAYRVALSGRLRAVDLRGEARAALIELEFVTGQEVIR